MRNPFTWNEIEHWTGADLMETVQLLDEDDVEGFMEAYGNASDDAEHNLRYIMGLVDSETAEALSELFMLLPLEDGEVIEPRQWWNQSSLGLREAS